MSHTTYTSMHMMLGASSSSCPRAFGFALIHSLSSFCFDCVINDAHDRSVITLNRSVITQRVVTFMYTYINHHICALSSSNEQSNRCIFVIVIQDSVPLEYMIVHFRSCAPEMSFVSYEILSSCSILS